MRYIAASTAIHTPPVSAPAPSSPPPHPPHTRPQSAPMRRATATTACLVLLCLSLACAQPEGRGRGRGPQDDTDTPQLPAQAAQAAGRMQQPPKSQGSQATAAQQEQPMMPRQAPKAEQPKAQQAEQPKAEQPKAEQPKTPRQPPKAEQPKAEQPKAEQPKTPKQPQPQGPKTPEQPPKAQDPKAQEKGDANARASGDVGARLTTLWGSTGSSSEATASAAIITGAGKQGRTSTQATAVATSIIAQASKRPEVVAESLVVASSRDTSATGVVLARTAVECRRRGQLDVFARSQIRAFVKARQRNELKAYISSVAISITVVEEEDDAVEAYAVVFADAFAAGGEEEEALAQATALAFCLGGDTGKAVAKVYSAAIKRNRRGCVVLTRARSIAVAQCKGGLFRLYSDTSVERTVLGGCGLYKDWSGFSVELGRKRLAKALL